MLRDVCPGVLARDWLDDLLRDEAARWPCVSEEDMNVVGGDCACTATMLDESAFTRTGAFLDLLDLGVAGTDEKAEETPRLDA